MNNAHRAQTGMEVPRYKSVIVFAHYGGDDWTDEVADPEGDLVKYKDHLAALAAAHAETASTERSLQYWMRECIGRFTDGDEQDAELRKMNERLAAARADNEAMRKLLGTCREALVKLRDYASGYNVASTIQIALDALAQQANDGGKGEAL